MGHVREEWFLPTDGIRYRLLHFQGDCLGQKNLGSMIFLQARHVPIVIVPAAPSRRILVFPMIGTRSTSTVTANIDVKSKVYWISGRGIVRSKVSLPRKQGLVSRVLQDSRKQWQGKVQAPNGPVAWALDRFRLYATGIDV